MKIRAICTDIDGTLLNQHRELSALTIETIKALGPDFPVILASSRMPSAMVHLQHELGIPHHPLIAYNGGYVIHAIAGKHTVLSSTEIPAAVVEHIISLAAGTDIHNSLYRNDQWFAPRRDEWTLREERITKVMAQISRPGDVIAEWKRLRQGAHKVMSMGPESEINALEEKLHEQLSSEIHIYRSRPTYLELAPKVISKATGLEVLLAELYDFPIENVMSFGDNYNDLEMITRSGLGIAVANARDEVKSVAQEITGKSIEDGVAYAIKKYCFS